MPRFVALLRGINVGGHRVKMDDLRRHFVALKFTEVSTFIASGNVIFETPGTAAPALEKKIEAHLEEKLGYKVPTFLRTPAELVAAAREVPFAPADMANKAWSRYVLFLREEPPSVLPSQLRDVNCATDEFCVHGREIHWLCRGKLSDDTPAAGAFEKILRAARLDGTLRNIKTVAQLAEVSARTITAPAAATGRSKAGRSRKA